MDEAYRNARNLIESAARQFEHSKPDASLAELDEFLRAKAEEWRELRGRLAALEAVEFNSKAIIQQAEAALSSGSLDKVDELLASAEAKLQNEHTLKAIEKQAALRITRGNAALLGEDPAAALAHYRAAARYFEPFDEQKAVETLQALAEEVYEGSLRSLEPRFFVAAELLEDISRTGLVQGDPEQSAKLNYRRGLVHLNAARGSQDENANLDAAVDFSRRATEVPQGTLNEFESACAYIGLANALMERGSRRKSIADIEDSIANLRTARVIAKEVPDAAPMASHVSNSLGAAILVRRRLKPDVSVELRQEALAEFEQAVVDSEEHSTPEVWGAAKVNVSRILAESARDAELSEPERDFLRIRAITGYQAGIETYPVTLFPDRFGDAQFELAGVLFEHSTFQQGQLSEIYLARAIQSYQMAAQVFEVERHPYRWAAIHMCVGSAFARHAQLETTFDKTSDFKQAITCYEEAARVFAELNSTEEALRCESEIKRLHAVSEAAKSETHPSTY